MTRYTPQQQQAIETRDSSIALAAGAGCGKTFVLTERFLSELDPKQGDRPLGGLVAITFTERAAREMRSRIRQACRDRLQQAAENQVDYWLRIVRDVDSARISTIHSFCGSLLRANAPQAGVDPQFQVLEGGVADPLRRMAIDESAEQLLLDRDPSVMELIREVGLERLMRIADRLILLRFQIRQQDWEALGPTGLAELWREKFHSEYLPLITEEILSSDELKELKVLLATLEPAEGVMLERWGRIRDLLQSGPAEGKLIDWLKELRENAKVQGTKQTTWPDAEIKDQVKESFEAFRKWVDKGTPDLEFRGEDLERLARIGHAAFMVAVAAIERYEQLKRNLGGLDFDDLLMRTRDLLRSSEEVRRRAGAGIEFLMVDEFQDTDPTQAEIVRALVGDGLKSGKLFLVGDSQQSIYRFRRADPRVFAALQQEIPERGRLPLTSNFRSQPAILNFVNALFGGDPQAQYEPLTPFDRQQYSPEPAIEFLFSADPEEAEENAESRRSREAEWISRRIKQLLADPTPRIRVMARKGEKPELRPVQAGDIVILFRALSDVQLYEEALRKAGLESYLVGGRAFYSQQEIFDIANLCRFLHDPTDHVSLLGVLRSPFCNLSDDAIFAVWRQEKDLWKGLQNEPPKELTENEQNDIRRAARVLRMLLERRDRSRIAPLLRLALDLTGYDAALLTEFLGQRKLANLQKLLEMARSFDQVGLFGLSEFVEQLNTAVLEETDEELAATHPEASNVIRLMTIHQSKGLEFPVVILADMERVGPLRTPEAVFDAELGTLINPPTRHGRKPEHIGMKMYLAREKREEQAETLRLLYVALTRAADHLILSGGLKNVDQPRSPWLKKLAERFDLETGEPQILPKNGGLVIPEPFAAVIPEVLAHREIPAVIEGKQTTTRGLPLGQFLPSVLEAVAETLPPPLDPEVIRRGSRRQVSISELEGLMNVEELAREDLSPDEFTGEKIGEHPIGELELIPAEELGTLVHSVLERLDYSKPETLTQLLSTIWSSSRTRLNAERQELARRLIEPFLKTSAAQEIAAARRSFREIDFLLQGKLLCAEGGDLLISGTIDQLLESAEGKWIVADFKTGRRLIDDPEQLRAEYELQLGIYALAVEQILGRLPDEVWLIHLRRSDPVIRFKLDEALISRVRKSARRAIQRLQAPVE